MRFNRFQVVVACALVVGVVGVAPAGVGAVPASISDPVSDATALRPVSVVVLTDTRGQRSAAAVRGLYRAQSGVGRASAPSPGGPDDVATGDVAVFTAPIVTGEFLVAGLSWDGDDELAHGTRIHLRVREDGVWSDWLETPDDQAGGAGRNGTAPFVTGGADAVQVHVSGRPTDLPAGLELNLLRAGSEASSSAREPASDVAPAFLVQPAVDRPVAVTPAVAAAAVLTAAVPAPTILTRAQWGADESIRDGWEAGLAPLRAAVVHHTAGTNTYTADQSAQIVANIYYYHAVTLDWGDVGYNFLVDKFGTVFEGRYGSVDAGAGLMRIGAHAVGYNTYSMGISAMGNYSEIAAEQVILDRMRDVIAWRFSTDSGFDMASLASFPANAYHDDLYLPRVFGHRDVIATVCPGDDISSRIPALLAAVNEVMGGGEPLPNVAPVADAGVDRTVKAGSTVTLSGTGSDANGDLLGYKWTQTGGSPTVSLANANTATTTFKAPALPKGTSSLVLTFQLTVTDDEGASATDAVVVKVTKR